MIDVGEISGKIGKDFFFEFLEKGGSVKKFVVDCGLF